MLIIFLLFSQKISFYLRAIRTYSIFNKQLLITYPFIVQIKLDTIYIQCRIMIEPGSRRKAFRFAIIATTEQSADCGCQGEVYFRLFLHDLLIIANIFISHRQRRYTVTVIATYTIRRRRRIVIIKIWSYWIFIISKPPSSVTFSNHINIISAPSIQGCLNPTFFILIKYLCTYFCRIDVYPIRGLANKAMKTVPYRILFR